MNEEVRFWLTMLTPIPLGIAINLVTPRCGRLLSRFNSTFRARQARRIQAFDEATRFFAREPAVAALYLIPIYVLAFLLLVSSLLVIMVSVTIFAAMGGAEQVITNRSTWILFNVLNPAASLFLMAMGTWLLRHFMKVYLATMKISDWPLLMVSVRAAMKRIAHQSASREAMRTEDPPQPQAAHGPQ
jgi:hypothetical protein